MVINQIYYVKKESFVGLAYKASVVKILQSVFQEIEF